MTEPASMTVVFVPGGRHDGWCWHLVQAELSERGIASIAPDLPFVTFRGDVETIEKTIDAIDGDVLLVAHSRGGSIISLAAIDRPKVKGLVYVAAGMTDDSDNVRERFPRNPEKFAQSRPELPLDPEIAREIFYHDVPEPLFQEALTHLRVVPKEALNHYDPGVPLAWRTRPTTYVICTDDHQLRPDAQRYMARNAGAVYEIDSSHSPFLSHPKELAEILSEVHACTPRDEATSS